MGKYKNVPENLRNTLEEKTENIKKAAKEAGDKAAKTVEDVKGKVNEITENTEKKVNAVKKTVKTVSEKKNTAAEAKPAAKKTAAKRTPAKKEKAVLAKNLKEKLTFQFNGAQIESSEILKRVEKDVTAKCGKITVKKLEIYFNAGENTAYYVVNDEAKPEYKVVF